MSDEYLPYLEMSTDQLDIILGEALVRDEFGAKDRSDVEKRTTAQRWLSFNLDKLRIALCSSSPVRKALVSPETEKRDLLFAAVIDALGTMRGLPVPVTVLSARMVHYGIDRLCAGEHGVDQV